MVPMTSSSPKPSGKSRQAPRSWTSTWAFRASTSRPCARRQRTPAGNRARAAALDSSDASALEAACRTYAGRPLINSVNGKAESLATVLPIAARYGTTIVGLTLDENGIPAHAEERVAIAGRIVDAALDAGLRREDIAIDCLVMAAATNQPEIPEILAAMRACRERLGVRCVLGVSNVSFGLPARPVLNASFLTAALASGLDLPIINPLEPRYREAIAAFRVINGQDAGCLEYVDAMQSVAISSEADIASEIEKSRPLRPGSRSGGDFSTTPPNDDPVRNDAGPAPACARPSSPAGAKPPPGRHATCS